MKMTNVYGLMARFAGVESVPMTRLEIRIAFRDDRNLNDPELLLISRRAAEQRAELRHKAVVRAGRVAGRLVRHTADNLKSLSFPAEYIRSAQDTITNGIRSLRERADDINLTVQASQQWSEQRINAPACPQISEEVMHSEHDY